MNKIKIALIYDFDGTLIDGNMQEYGLFSKLNVDPTKFWEESNIMSKKSDMNSILAYMYLLIMKAREQNIKLTKSALNNLGKKLIFFDGVTEWFDLINSYRDDVNLEHYIISSGSVEIIEGCEISKYIKKIYASAFLFDDENLPIWPKVVIDYTAKTQYLFRINKGIENNYDNSTINKFVKQEDRAVPFSNMVYFGDGDTDIPAMKVVKDLGGTSVAVYPKGNIEKSNNCKKLLNDDRANYTKESNYRKDSELHVLIKQLIDKIVIENNIKKL